MNSGSQCSRTLLRNITIKGAHCVNKRNSSKMCEKHSRMWSKLEHCIRMWYSDSPLVQGKVCIINYSRHMCLNTLCRFIVSMANNKVAALKCIDVRNFPAWRKIWFCNYFSMSWYIGIAKRPHSQLLMHHETRVLHPI